MPSIYKTEQTLIENSEAWQLLQQFPHAISHDTTNTVFRLELPNAVNPYVLPETNEAGDPLSIDQVAVLAAVWLYGQSDKAMHLTKNQALSLFQHPAHKLWCAKYEDDQRDQFESDYTYVGAFISATGSAVAWPAFTHELTPVKARDYMLFGLSHISVE